MSVNITVLPGDGIGQEIVREALKVLDVLNRGFDLKAEWEEAAIGGDGYDRAGDPYPEETRKLAHASDAVLLGAVGGAKWEGLAKPLRPEAGLLGIRADLGLFANYRPAKVYDQLLEASTLKPEVVQGVDILVVRELVSGVYFGQPRGIVQEGGQRRGINTMSYTESEVERIARTAFAAARLRSNRVCSVDKANVLEVSELWRETVIRIKETEFPDVELTHMYVDNAAMQLIRNPKQFDVMVTGNLFGDILSDEASMLTGSIGMLPSASIGDKYAMYEPIHGSAPDIAGQNKANPLATILSVAMMLRYSLDQAGLADKVEAAVEAVLDDGLRTPDLAGGSKVVSCSGMGDAVCEKLQVMAG
ncbi:MAG: 3-isopropylmalate dehydrogenase [Zetaproteobacteria bacterium CG12_big_fil_rev_8_21_14_0_65_55_1124]|nr:MAG: 3-isopropylmalate dehydrogenase [Zetaproteobacteria bacterium CG1_02_55_237]PIS20498.1 MAG: 3-isopropylmalate dehydrogenase [Zetaproteobacteria bacterium CG08_land_8_20_14_0_20_55_17]PIW43776.1 MAG: 3-isopropylmalate dehydrogenase [Zetaproteobacteria bacterium CG12_big_fil_rev_8_21_14_0_65_55_1124]PIY53311.1 MAG: 3-isopropylmalate dehydrogenase [Zetaproteobacteria bacterium CG_4_10_14_0_8_um_filter_55_43]PIZ40116.1 MAG: 3-isopropylmalate dehydrogenase [Zetaproteobacteria bacterium CG_4_